MSPTSVSTLLRCTAGVDIPPCDTLAFSSFSSAQVDVDLIFVKARQGKHVFSLMARKGFVCAGDMGCGEFFIPPIRRHIFILRTYTLIRVCLGLCSVTSAV